MTPPTAVVPDPLLSHELPIAVIPSGAAGRRILARNLEVSADLAGRFVKKSISPDDVIDVLNRAGVRFVLAGAHMIGSWANQPRLTQDVDVLVASRHVRAAVRALQAAFPRLRLQDTPVVARFEDPDVGQVVIDVMKPNQPLFKVAMRHVKRVRSGKRVYHIPSLEFALAMKFAAMVSPLRGPGKKLYDGGDFVNMVQANPVIDLDRLAKLGDRVYAGGGKEIVGMVATARAGRRLEF